MRRLILTTRDTFVVKFGMPDLAAIGPAHAELNLHEVLCACPWHVIFKVDRAQSVER